MCAATDATLAKLERMCGRNPASILFARLADALLRLGNVDRAAEICREGLRYRPLYPTGHLVMGRCHMAAGRLEDARRELQHTLALDYDNPSASWLLGKIERKMGFEERALSYFRYAGTVDPFSRLPAAAMDAETQAEDEPHSTSGPGNETKRPAPDATVEADRALAGREDLSVLLRDLKEHPGHVEDRSADSDTEIAPIATSTLAELYAGQGLIEEAVTVLARVCERQPDNKRIKKRLKELRKMEGACTGG
ncbi:MAG: tetratricopeptide repeat protein [Gemmatimonadota bacterium]|nr:tetratricopeptide repeat protein [Gemmatimonadota bacterium]